MKFRTKILLAIWGVVLALLLVTYFVINYWIRVQVVSRFGEDLRSNCSAVRELEILRAGEIVRSSQVVAESPRMKATLELGDRTTAAMLSQELSRNIRSDLFVLTDSGGHPMVELFENRQTGSAPGTLPGIPFALRRQSASDVWADSNKVYRCASVPITIGPDLIGTLTIGFRIRPEDILSVQSMTNSAVALVTDSGFVFSTLEPSVEKLVSDEIARSGMRLNSASGGSPPIFTLQTGSERFACAWCRLDRGTSDRHSGTGFLLLKLVESEVQSLLAPVVRTFVILSLMVLILTAGIGFLISEGITRPIAALVRGTAEVSRGNYDYRIDVGGGGEMNYLAQHFGEMSRSLKEKISELEDALRRLKLTQSELVKSERLAATGKLTAQLAHEINNPIHNIQSCFQMILKKIDRASPDRELLEVGYEEVERLAKLTRQMLDVYRTSMVPIEREPLDLDQIVEEVVTSSSQTLQDRGAVVSLQLDRQLPPISGSRDKLKQVLLNLLLNARDAMPGGGTITISSKTEGASVHLAVSDTGSGIAPEHINHIFDAFFTTKSNVSGVGLGLSVTYGIVKQHDGTITVDSTPGRGTIFHLVFPAIQSGGTDEDRR